MMMYHDDVWEGEGYRYINRCLTYKVDDDSRSIQKFQMAQSHFLSEFYSGGF